MENKKKSGFTLIELLAIIVILAIIAVITVPIILNVIESSKKGAAVDSAYGYADGIEKFFVSKVSENMEYNMPDGTYYVDNTTGHLIGTGDIASNAPLEVKVSGSIPDSGSVELLENEIKSACLQFGNYKVEITDGLVGKAEEGACIGGGNTSSPTTPTPTPSNAITASTLPNVVEEGPDGELRKIDHTNGTTDYRYMGHDPYNYIYFNCSNYALEEQNDTNCEVWRIISIENNQFKIIRNSLSTKMEWDTNSTNNWANASLKTYLNGDYYNSLTAETKSKISSSTWYLGGWGQAHEELMGISEDEYFKGTGMFPEGAYLFERGTEKRDTNYPSTVTANIGLLYPSDYGFASRACHSLCAATDTSCGQEFGTYNLSSSNDWSTYDSNTRTWIVTNPKKLYDDTVCTSSNWLYTNTDYWTITQHTYEEACIWLVQKEGDMHGYSIYTTDTYEVRPTLYLNSNIELEGTGSITDPFKIIP